MEILLLGHMGRDEALADRLVQQGNRLHVVGAWHNPGLVEKAETSGGSFYAVRDVTDAHMVASVVEHIQPDMFVTNLDDALAAGVVDAIHQKIVTRDIQQNLLLPCPNKEAARIEWDKFFLRELIDEINPSYNPLNYMATTPQSVVAAFELLQNSGVEAAIKPRNLTGGKGVKVMGKHLDTYEAALQYALDVLDDPRQSGVEVQEKLEGREFTLQLFTDGRVIILPPETYDYPYREDGDTGPGTGGMGALSMPIGEHLPFVSDEEYHQAVQLMKELLAKLEERGIDYKGVLYPTFFKTNKGLKIVEINARGGDPELINIVDVADENVDFADVLKRISEKELTADSVRYQKLASTMVYLVAPEYGYTAGPQYDFTLDRGAIKSSNCLVRFAAAQNVQGSSNRYSTVGTSRTVGISALGTSPEEARARIHTAIRDGFQFECPLQFRRDVGLMSRM